MHRSAQDLDRIFTDRQFEILRAIGDYREQAGPFLAVRERMAAGLSRYEVLRDGRPANPSRPGVVRRCLGAWVVRLGGWLGGVPTSPAATSLAPDAGGAK